MVRALATAQVQSVREITKKADIKKTNKKLTIFVLAFFISLIVLYICFLGYTYFVSSRYEYKESEAGINFYSKEFGVRNAITKTIDSSEILIVVNINQEDLNYTEYITEPVVLLNTIFVYKNQKTVTLINTTDSRNNIINCVTNKGDIYTNDLLEKKDCEVLLNSESSKIIIDFPSSTLKESAVYVDPEKKTISIKTKNVNDTLKGVYLILKSRYSDLEDVLSKVEEVKKKIGEETLSNLDQVSSNDLLEDN